MPPADETPSREGELKDLHRRFGDQALPDLLRKLAVKADDPRSGPQARRLLQVLSGGREMPDAASWRTWLDSQPAGAPSWESVLPPPKTLRQRVEMVEERVPPVAAAPMTAKQRIWSEAMARHRAGRPRGNRLWIYVPLIVLLTILAWRTAGYWWPGISGPGAGSAADQGLRAFSPVLVWGDFDDSPLGDSAWRCPLGGVELNTDFLAALDLDGAPGGMVLAVEQLRKGDLPAGWERTACWANLRQYETLPTVTGEAPGGRLSPAGTLPGGRRWRWTRAEGDLVLASGSCREEFQADGAALQYTFVREEDGGAGSVHKVTLDAWGLRSWVFRIKLGEVLLNGSATRSADRGTVAVVFQDPGAPSCRSSIQVPASTVLLPALWTPFLAARQGGLALLPFAGTLCESAEFFQRQAPDNPDRPFGFKARAGSWQEKWVPAR